MLHNWFKIRVAYKHMYFVFFILYQSNDLTWNGQSFDLALTTTLCGGYRPSIPFVWVFPVQRKLVVEKQKNLLILKPPFIYLSFHLFLPSLFSMSKIGNRMYFQYEIEYAPSHSDFLSSSWLHSSVEERKRETEKTLENGSYSECTSKNSNSIHTKRRKHVVQFPCLWLAVSYLEFTQLIVKKATDPLTKC